MFATLKRGLYVTLKSAVTFGVFPALNYALCHAVCRLAAIVRRA